MKNEVRRMTKEILEIAKAEGLCDDSLGRRLVLRMANRDGRSRGGIKDGAPWMSIAMKGIGWNYADPDKVAERLRLWTERLDSSICGGYGDPKARKWVNAFKRVNLARGDGVWMEYPAIAKDPEIGDLYGAADDALAPLAVLLCHELAHVIDYNCGALEIAGRSYGPRGTVHGNKWRAIYRVLRNAYVATGAYKPAPTAEIIEFKPKPLSPVAPELIGLPLFDLAA